MAQLHGHQREATHEEGEKQCEAVGVVQTGRQHERQQDGKSQSGSRGQNIEPPPLQSERQGVASLTPLDPDRHPLAEEVFHDRV